MTIREILCCPECGSLVKKTRNRVISGRHEKPQYICTNKECLRSTVNPVRK